MSSNATAEDLRSKRLISLEQEYEIRYWTKSLRVTEEYLRQLIATYGPNEMTIREALRHTAAS
jgi:hypothetical protein